MSEFPRLWARLSLAAWSKTGARLLRGNAEEANASGRGQRGTAASIAFYQAVLRLVPDHATAHSVIFIHSYETIGRIDKALEHGETFARLAPWIPPTCGGTTFAGSAAATMRSRSSSRRTRSNAASMPPRRSIPR